MPTYLPTHLRIIFIFVFTTRDSCKPHHGITDVVDIETLFPFAAGHRVRRQSSGRAFHVGFTVSDAEIFIIATPSRLRVKIVDRGRLGVICPLPYWLLSQFSSSSCSAYSTCLASRKNRRCFAKMNSSSRGSSSLLHNSMSRKYLHYSKLFATTSYPPSKWIDMIWLCWKNTFE